MVALGGVTLPLVITGLLHVIPVLCKYCALELSVKLGTQLQIGTTHWQKKNSVDCSTEYGHRTEDEIFCPCQLLFVK